MGPPSLASTLPGEVLQRIFQSVNKRDEHVLGIEERVRSEVVCKHWCSQLHEQPLKIPQITLSMGRVARCKKNKLLAEWLAARAPTIENLRLHINMDDAGLASAMATALGALLPKEAVQTLFITIQDEAAEDLASTLRPFLAALSAGPHALPQLILNWEDTAYSELLLRRGAGAPASCLDGVRQLEVHPGRHAVLEFSLPMAQLERLTVTEAPDTDEAPGGPSVALGPAGGEAGGAAAAPLLPALTRLSLSPRSLRLHSRAMPALRELSLSPTSTALAINGGLPSQLTALTLAPMTGWYPKSNFVAPVLRSAPRTLRRLSLSLCEQLDAVLGGALRKLTALTSLRVSSEYAMEETTLDCRLLQGMQQLEELVAWGKLENAGALDALPNLKRRP